VDLVRVALADIEASVEKLASDAMAIADGAAAERASRSAAEAAAESYLAKLRMCMAERKERLTEFTMELRESAGVLAKAQKLLDACDEALNTLAEQKEQLENASRDILGPLRDGLVTGAKAKKQVATLVLLGQKFDFDDTLLLGLPPVLTNRPDARSSFDMKVEHAFDSLISSCIAELDAKLTEGTPEREAHSAAVQTAQRAHAEVSVKQRENMAHLERARVAVNDGEVALEAARRKVELFGPESRQVQANCEWARSRLAAFRKGPLASFKELEKGTIDAFATDE